jgi:hypothetical protein
MKCGGCCSPGPVSPSPLGGIDPTIPSTLNHPRPSQSLDALIRRPASHRPRLGTGKSAETVRIIRQQPRTIACPVWPDVAPAATRQ